MFHPGAVKFENKVTFQLMKNIRSVTNEISSFEIPTILRYEKGMIYFIKQNKFHPIYFSTSEPF